MVEPTWCFIDVARKAGSGGTMSRCGRICKTVVKPMCMGKPVASSNREIVGSVRRLLAIGVNESMSFQKGGGREGSVAPWMKAYEVCAARRLLASKKKTYPSSAATASCKYARCDKRRSRLAES